MTKTQLEQSVTENMESTREALQLLYNNINKGQQKQIVKRTEIKALFDKYGVEY